MLKWLWCLLFGHKWKYQYATQARCFEWDIVSDIYYEKQKREFCQGTTTFIFRCDCCGKLMKFTTIGHSVNLKEQLVESIMES